MAIAEEWREQVRDRGTGSQYLRGMQNSDELSWLWTSGVLKELHRLLWVKPHSNKGRWDPGWSCRDHAAVIAALLSLRDVRSDIRHGWCTIIQGATQGQPPVGMGQSPPERTGHSWGRVDNLGDIDFSPRFDSSRQPWRPLRSLGIVGSAWKVEGIPDTNVIVCRDAVAYEHEIERAFHLESAARMVYLVKEQQPFGPSMLHVDFVNSPLTDRIRSIGGDYIYAKLVVHLDGIASGRERSLPGQDEKKWWRTVARVPDSAVDSLFERLAMNAQ
jgi:hypothetical protein